MAIMSPDWIVSNDTIVRPDILIVTETIKTDYLEFPPVLIIEIGTPYTNVKDRQVKFQIYREQGVKYYMMADYEKQSVEAFELINTVYQEVKKNTFRLNNGCEIIFDYHQCWEKINIGVQVN